MDTSKFAAYTQIAKILMIKEDYPLMHNKLKCIVEHNTLHAQIGYKSCIKYIGFMSPQLPHVPVYANLEQKIS